MGCFPRLLLLWFHLGGWVQTMSLVILRIANLRRMHEVETTGWKEGEHWTKDKDPSFFHAFSLPKPTCDPDLVWKSSPFHPGITFKPLPRRPIRFCQVS